MAGTYSLKRFLKTTPGAETCGLLCNGGSALHFAESPALKQKKLPVQRNTKINKKRNGVVTLPWRLRLR